MTEDQNLPQGSEPLLEPAIGAETGSQLPDARSDGSAGGETAGNDDASADTGATDLDAAGTDDPQPVDPQHSHQSVLSMLLTDLEGMIHMSKTEIIAQVDKARKLFESL